MARITGDGLTNFSGKLSNIVGFTLNGIQRIRSMPTHKRKYKPSEKQFLNQQRFKFANEQVTNFRSLLDLSIEKKPGQFKASQSMSNLLRKAVNGVYPDFSLDYSQLLVSSGSLPPATGAVASSVQTGVLKFEWTDETPVKDKKNYWGNRALLIAYDDFVSDVFFELQGPLRMKKNGELKVPFWSGRKVHTWISFHSADFELKADSVYTGLIEVA